MQIRRLKTVLLAAAAILHNRASQPVVMVLWAERVQRRQRSEKAEPATTAPPVQLPLPLVGEL